MSCKYRGDEYSEGAEICQAGRVRKCNGNEWVDTGRECTVRTGEEALSTVPEATPDEIGKAFSDADSKAPGFGTLYAISGTMRKAKPYLYFDGSKSVSKVCNLEVQRWRVRLDAIDEIVEMGFCDTGKVGRYSAIVTK